MNRTLAAVVAATVAVLAVGFGYGVGALTSQHDVAVAAPVPSVKSAVGAWANGGGAQHSRALATVLGSVGQAAKTGNIAAMSVNCQALETAVDSAIEYGAVPDAETQKHWSSALFYLRSASQECVTGIATMDVPTIQQATRDTQSATSELQLATNRMNQIVAGS